MRIDPEWPLSSTTWVFVVIKPIFIGLSFSGDAFFIIYSIFIFVLIFIAFFIVCLICFEYLAGDVRNL